MQPVITVKSVEFPANTMMARRDHAITTGEELIEPPDWYEHVETGEQYHGIYGAMFWPGKIEESKGKGYSGYAAVLGVLKDRAEDAKCAPFALLEEFESYGIEALAGRCIELREKYGFHKTKPHMGTWYGDPDRFDTVIGQINSALIETGGEDNVLLISPPFDFDRTNAFDIYVRRIQEVVAEGSKRLFFNDCGVVRNHMQAFTADCPAIWAVGGLVHTLLLSHPWMEQAESAVWVDDEENLKQNIYYGGTEA